jgi:hypothetical protein
MTCNRQHRQLTKTIVGFNPGVYCRKCDLSTPRRFEFSVHYHVKCFMAVLRWEQNALRSISNYNSALKSALTRVSGIQATILVRMLGPRAMFSIITIGFGVIIMVSCSYPHFSMCKELMEHSVYGFHTELEADDRNESPSGDFPKCYFPRLVLLDLDVVYTERTGMDPAQTPELTNNLPILTNSIATPVRFPAIWRSDNRGVGCIFELRTESSRWKGWPAWLEMDVPGPRTSGNW